jgi:Fur family transcriptional regulator, zinc uptake regulator
MDNGKVMLNSFSLYTGLFPHDHDNCQQHVLDTAAHLCQQRQSRFTPLREQVLRLICQSHKPLGAYDLLEQLQQLEGHRVAPPTIYRALEFLLEQGFIHRISSLNAFIACFHPEQSHYAYFLICRACGNAVEFASDSFAKELQDITAQAQFNLTASTVELFGYCPHCQAKTEAEHDRINT